MDLTQRVRRHLAARYDLSLGQQALEEVAAAVKAMAKKGTPNQIEVKGRDMGSGNPATVVLTVGEAVGLAQPTMRR